MDGYTVNTECVANNKLKLGDNVCYEDNNEDNNENNKKHKKRNQTNTGSSQKDEKSCYDTAYTICCCGGICCELGECLSKL